MSVKTLKPVARVVQLADFQDRRLLLEDFSTKRSDKPRAAGLASVVSLRERVGCFASIEIDEVSALTPIGQRDAVMALVRDYLAMEFGQLRITQLKRTFTVRHRNVEEMIGALLRVQYHVYQCTAQDLEAVDVPESFVAMNLTWGIGSSAIDADAERLKRRRRKRFR